MDHGGLERSEVKTTNKDAGQLKLRLPDGLKEALRVEAAANERSLNGEIVNRLRSTFKGKLDRQPSGDRRSTDTLEAWTDERQLAVQQPGK